MKNIDDYNNDQNPDIDKLKSMLNEKDKFISLQEKDIDCLKREINDLKNIINCFQNEKKC